MHYPFQHQWQSTGEAPWQRTCSVQPYLCTALVTMPGSTLSSWSVGPPSLAQVLSSNKKQCPFSSDLLAFSWSGVLVIQLKASCLYCARRRAGILSTRRCWPSNRRKVVRFHLHPPEMKVSPHSPSSSGRLALPASSGMCHPLHIAPGKELHRQAGNAG